MSRLAPSRTSVQYAVRKSLVAWLRAQDTEGLRVLDVGCGDRPYAELFPGATGFDVPGNPHADLHGSLEAIPVDDASFDVVLCLQVLEHVPDPGAAIRELHRVVRPGGRVLLSTHGVYPFHPNPDDLWRWTHTGLERLFEGSASWRSVTVTPGAGTGACLGMLISTYVDLATQRLHVMWLGNLGIRLVNRVAGLFDRLAPSLREPRPGSLFANYHVEAER